MYNILLLDLLQSIKCRSLRGIGREANAECSMAHRRSFVQAVLLQRVQWALTAFCNYAASLRGNQASTASNDTLFKRSTNNLSILLHYLLNTSTIDQPEPDSQCHAQSSSECVTPNSSLCVLGRVTGATIRFREGGGGGVPEEIIKKQYT